MSLPSTLRLLVLAGLLAIGPAGSVAADDGPTTLDELVETARNGVVVASDGRLHLARELRHLARERWWPEAADAGEDSPTRILLETRTALRERGIELLVAPVPSRSALAPGTLPVRPSPELDRAFLRYLEEAGLEVLDLHSVLEPLGEEAWCRTDTHWSPRGLEAAARAIADRLGRPREEAPDREVTGEDLEIEGDLSRLLADDGDRETVRIHRVGGPPTVERGAPVLLLGDSHTLVFHAGGDLHAEGAGLPDHLARQLGEPVDLVGVRGSGSTAARINLFRRGAGALDHTEVVVWVFALRETTEELPWRSVPLPPPG